MKMKKKLFPIMFHHFHDNKKHVKSQGSLDKDKLYKLIKKIGIKNILSPDDFIHKTKNNKIQNYETCITFDDGIKSQFDVAYPLLKDLKIKSFFFIYSSIFGKKLNLLELNRYFREVCFKNIDQYYQSFYNILNKEIDKKTINKILDKKRTLFIKQKKIWNFYSISDLEFRFIRDRVLDRDKFEKISIQLFKKKEFDYKSFNKNIYINKKNLEILSKDENAIGLHSHSHPTNFDKLSYSKQFEELKKNKQILERISKNNIFSMAYPLGRFNSNSLKILKKLKIKIAFLSQPNFQDKSPYKTSREDHTILSKRLGL